MKIAIFYHALLRLGNPPPPMPLPAASQIIPEQMGLLQASGLLAAATELHVGINDEPAQAAGFAQALFPLKARLMFHGLQCRNECRTIRMIEQWLPGHEDWLVFFFHSKGASHPPGNDFSARWRKCMERHAIYDWRLCVGDLLGGYEAAGSHWMVPPETPPGHHIFAGNFWWARADYLRTLPSIMARDRIKTSGIDALESRYEAEVWLGNGPRVPSVHDYHRHWNPSKIATCQT